MNKYQEALNKIVKSCCPNCSTNGCKDCSIEKICNATAKQWVDTLQKLIDQTKTPTIEEVKKEWEALGYEEIRHERRMLIFERKEDGTFFILSKFADVAYEKHWNGRVKQIHFKEHQLLTKTFRALGWFDE